MVAVGRGRLGRCIGCIIVDAVTGEDPMYDAPFDMIGFVLAADLAAPIWPRSNPAWRSVAADRRPHSNLQCSAAQCSAHCALHSV
jgi:hypothetical protein